MFINRSDYNLRLQEALPWWTGLILVMWHSDRCRKIPTGVAPGIFLRGLTLPTGTKIWFSGYFRCKNLLQNGFLPSDGGLTCSNIGAIVIPNFQLKAEKFWKG